MESKIYASILTWASVLVCHKTSEDCSYLQVKGTDPQFNAFNLKVDTDGSCRKNTKVWPNKENSKKWNVFCTNFLTRSYLSFNSCSEN